MVPVRALVLAACVAAIGCAKKEEAPAAKPSRPLPPEISTLEAERGDAACAGLVKKTCECAAEHPALKGDCELAQTRPEALELAIKVARENTKTDPRDQWQAHNNARKIMKACIEDDLKFRCEAAAAAAAAKPADPTPADSADAKPADADPPPAQ